MLGAVFFALLFSNAMGQTISPGVVGYVPVFIPGTNIPYLFSPVSKLYAGFDRNITGFARFVNARGLYMYTPLLGSTGQFIIEPALTISMVLFSSTGISIQPADFLPVYQSPSRSGVPITTKNIGVIPLYVSSKGEDKLRALVSWSLDASGRIMVRPASSWDTIVYKKINPPLFIESPIKSQYVSKSTTVNLLSKTSNVLPKTTPGLELSFPPPPPKTTPGLELSFHSTYFKSAFSGPLSQTPPHSLAPLHSYVDYTPYDDRKGPPVLYPVVMSDGVMKLMSNPPPGFIMGKIPMLSNTTAGDMFIPVYVPKLFT